MTFRQFLEADEMEQIEAIWRGKLIAEHSDGEYRHELFEVDGFLLRQKRILSMGLSEA